jgi:RNA polymerase sigma factor (sigma-70 family)
MPGDLQPVHRIRELNRYRRPRHLVQATVVKPGDLDPERFAADDRFVRALLGRFVSDPNTIDDLAQETWLVAMMHAAGGGAFGRPWLSAVARNFAFQTLRADQRRMIRESAVAKEVAADAIGDPRCDAELRDRVLRAVAELDDPHREAVRLRFFEDLTPAEISKRTQVPVETIRTRVKRGLARIHRQLIRRNA